MFDINNMKNLCTVFLVLFGIAAASASVLPVNPSFLQYKEGQRFFYGPGKNGRLTLVDLEERDGTESRFDADNDVVLNLYTRSNPTSAQVIRIGNAGSLGNFGKGKATKIIAHGWNNNGNSEINYMVRDAFLKVLDVNIISVDWGKGANGLYTTACDNVPKVGAHVGKLVDWLVDQGASVGNFHIMGHSLGGHVAGIGARSVTKGKITYVTGFDPASPLWGSGSQRIRPSDGAYVEIIHTNAGNLGLDDPVGHNDFYPNGGSAQPGCSVVDVGCSHGRSYAYFADSLDHTGFQANLCSNHIQALNNQCSNLGKLHMGGSKTKAAKGPFHLFTNANKPYYKG